MQKYQSRKHHDKIQVMRQFLVQGCTSQGLISKVDDIGIEINHLAVVID